LSGGVDSTAAMMLSLRNFEGVRAVFVDTRGKGPPIAAVKSAESLGVSLLVADAEKAFAERVRKPSEEAYAAGLTPNPCVLCNAGLKLATAHEILDPGETLVTGHYAGYQNNRLTRGADSAKDQSYFLGMVPGCILNRCGFPLGELEKTRVRSMVVETGLPFIEKESQDLCFNLERGGRPGDMVSVDGDLLGRHYGLGDYTVGQRRGIGAHGVKMYVVRLEPLANRLVLGEWKHLAARGCTVTGVNDLDFPGEATFSARVQVRSRHRAAPALVTSGASGFRVEFGSLQMAVAPGQTAVFYRENTVMGAGTIRKVTGA